MLQRFCKALHTFHYSLYFSLLLLGFVPTVYTTVRVFWLAQLPDPWSFSIAGQLAWVNLLYEILSEGMILPLFYFVGQCKDDKPAFANRFRKPHSHRNARLRLDLRRAGRCYKRLR